MGVTPRSEEDARYSRAGGRIIRGSTPWAGRRCYRRRGDWCRRRRGRRAGRHGAGAAIGAVAGGLAGKGAAEVVNPRPGDDRGEHNLAKGGATGGGGSRRNARCRWGPRGYGGWRSDRCRGGRSAGQGTAEVANPTRQDELEEHNLSTGVGAGGGALAGAAVGAAGGPSVWRGAAIGAVAGGAAGKGAGQVANPKPGDKSRA